ncbi:hypothetical protein PRABACTJOHN_03779 [Parabacteroides johnsonii DSM 18315]|uniref:Uncharacterized protein n=1 Tax=Parabacteroides johnsonii DSM 18315 TaxID=537006 RepID=B7BFF0_9BACT|nr:hypothetical protein [Parabacteroides johnsonii]EEC94822.1 hypothetical protein PRABACTJOHN_03779 [Parabacteroides johnsonii DSM 18315]UEA90915.1 hypothetical protein LK449_01450 [Parabacteroides johnsonii]UWP43070.1 hypothetical protein NQ564_00415 [Parabacteroides johnsonii DSM 18315]
MIINNNNHHPKKRKKYEQIALAESLFNKTKGVSFSSCKYTEVKTVIVKKIGKVYLAPKEKTVILSDEAKATAKRLRLSFVDVLDACNRFELDSVKSSMYTSVGPCKKRQIITKVDYVSINSLEQK